jgi:predicted O-methyltransferase YrrM
MGSLPVAKSFFSVGRKVLPWVAAVSIGWLGAFFLPPTSIIRAYESVRWRPHGRALVAAIAGNPAVPLDKLLAPIPQPFSTALASMHHHEPQLGTDGVMHDLTHAGVTAEDGVYIYELCRRVRARSTLEVGFAEGLSTLYFLAAAKADGAGPHVAIDPFENSDYYGIGLQKVRETGMSADFRFLAEKSVSALPRLAAEGSHYDVIFIDGDHKYDSELADFVLADVLCPKGGYLLFHDIWMDSTMKLASFIQRNRADYERQPTGVNIAAFRKIGDDRRDYRHFVDF